ncbi:MAG: hypothetical protein ACKOT0_03510, partial [bacterium]
MTSPARPGRAVPAVLGLLAGVAIGLLAGFLHAVRTPVGGFSVPGGAVLALGLVVLLVRAAVDLSRGRWAGWWAFAGWLAATVALSVEGPGGDLVVSAGARPLAYLFGGVVLGSAAASI